VDKQVLAVLNDRYGSVCPRYPSVAGWPIATTARARLLVRLSVRSGCAVVVLPVDQGPSDT
jgi:hypothetical protein